MASSSVDPAGDGEVVAYILHFMFRISSIIYTPLAATTTSSKNNGSPANNLLPEE